MPDLLEAIASKRVRQIINSLAEGPKTLTELSSGLSISKPALLKHSNQMQALGIITSEDNKIKGGREKRYSINPFSFHFFANDGFAFSLASFGPLDMEYPFLCQAPEEKRHWLKQRMRAINSLKPDASILLADKELLLISDNWNDLERISIEETVSPAKCIFWRYSDMNATDSFTSRIKEQSIALYSKDEKVFRMLKKYKALDVK
ncbi:MAG: winged helix-turn-helix domain-containing protein [Candidatus Thermoplasmatota archaeon]|nr:winged helix-turn-helix domain-containing protein [Candidatus Thermoplasmatota archaeon]